MLISADAQKKGPRWSGGLIEWSTLIGSLSFFQKPGGEIGEASAFCIAPLQKPLVEMPGDCDCHPLRAPESGVGRIHRGVEAL
jgi:hypothetical protein